MFTEPESTFYDLSTAEGREKYSDAIGRIAGIWAANFEDGGDGDGDPYEIGQGEDLWVDVVERWDEDFGDDVVSDIDEARRIGAEACATEIELLVFKRNED